MHRTDPHCHLDLVARSDDRRQTNQRRRQRLAGHDVATRLDPHQILFAEQRPDVALVEVGLGGRLDATHAWDGGVAAITNVALDHMEQLGPTIEAIAREKAAIIERGDVAVTGATGSALAIVRRRAARLGVVEALRRE